MTRLNDVGADLFAFWASAVMQFRQNRKHPLIYTVGVLNPILFLAVLVVPAGAAITGARAASALTGVTLAAFWTACVWGGVGILRKERREGTFTRSLVSTRNPLLLLTGKVAGACVLNLFIVLATVLVGAAAVGLRPTVADPLAVLIGLMATSAAGIAASQLVGAILVVTRHSLAVSNAIGIPVTLLGGTILPISLFPEPVTWLSWLISLSWLQKFLASAAVGPTNWWYLLLAGAVTAAYAIVARSLFDRLVDRALGAGSHELT